VTALSIPRSIIWIAALLGIALIASTEQAIAQKGGHQSLSVDRP
jgi:hypothetical protein